MGKKFYNLIVSIILITIPSILFKILLFQVLKPYVFYPLFVLSVIGWFLTTYFIFKSGTMDPGILEKDRNILDISPITCTRPPKVKIRVNGHILYFNICLTCNIYRPPRTSHCSVCDNCVERFDHHCDWIGTCVGKRNQKFFYYFLLLLVVLILYQESLYIVMIVLAGSSNYNPEVYSNYKLYLGFCLALMFYNICFLFFVGKLFVYQTYLLSNNITFYEDHKNKLKSYPVNPYTKLSFWGNLCNILCKRVPKSLLFLFNQTNNNRTKDDINIIETDLIQGILMKTPNSQKTFVSKINSRF